MSTANSQIILAILQASPAIVAGITGLINHFKAQNPGVTFEQAVAQFFVGIDSDTKAYLANQAEIAADAAANTPAP